MDRQLKNKKMLEALRCFLRGESVAWSEKISESEWEDFFGLCMSHQILPMVYEAVYTCPAFASISSGKVGFLKSQVIRQVMIQSRKTEEFLQLYRKLTREGLTPLVVKGLVCRSLYREPDYRCSGDEDVLIPEEQFETCHQVFLEGSMKPLDPQMDIQAEGEVPYCRQGGVLHIELHKELFSSESEAYGRLNEFFTRAFERKIRMEIGGTEIYTMCHTDHLLYLILHAFKHFLHSGFGIRQVCDIAVCADTYGKEIDWDYILEKCKERFLFVPVIFNGYVDENGKIFIACEDSRKLVKEPSLIIDANTQIVLYYDDGNGTYLLENIKEGRYATKDGYICLGTLTSYKNWRISGYYKSGKIFLDTYDYD